MRKLAVLGLVCGLIAAACNASPNRSAAQTTTAATATSTTPGVARPSTSAAGTAPVATTPRSVAPVTTGVSGAGGGAVPTTAGVCGTLPLSGVSYTHVVWIFMENHSSPAIIGSRGAPYLNSLVQRCGLAANFHNITHPSLPNYVGATTGLALGSLQTFGPDCDPSRSCSTSAQSIFQQGETWAAYDESMPIPCDDTNAGEYAVRHNPPPYFTTLGDCAAHDVAYTELGPALADSTLPAFSFITPNLIDDMHDGTIADGDSWLARNLPTIFDSPLYQQGHVVVMLTWDEGEGGTSGDCATNTTDVGCHIPAVIMSPSTVAGTDSAALFSDYSLLATTEDLLHLPRLGQAAAASSMASAFNL